MSLWLRWAKNDIIYSYFMAVWGTVKTTAPRCCGQQCALLPEAKGNCIELSMAPRGSSFDFSPNSHEVTIITQQILKTPVFSPRTVSLIGMRCRYTHLASWCSMSFLWHLTSSKRSQTKLLPAAFALRLNGWCYDHGIVDSIDRMVTSYTRRYASVAPACLCQLSYNQPRLSKLFHYSVYSKLANEVHSGPAFMNFPRN